MYSLIMYDSVYLALVKLFRKDSKRRGCEFMFLVMAVAEIKVSIKQVFFLNLNNVHRFESLVVFHGLKF